jgi:ATP-dependent Clp protease adapter protein ClpS
MARAAVSTERKKQVEEDVGGGGDPWKTILFNCSCHTFDQVENILIKATHCSLARAREISWEIHSKGSSVVYEGHRERCEAVAEVIASVGLRVKVAQ